MLRYVAMRLLMLVPVLFGILFLVFVLMRIVPGDPVALVAGPEVEPSVVKLIRADLGLDRPIHEQFVIYVSDLLNGELGRSIRTNRAVSAEIWLPFVNTLYLTGLSMAMAIVFGMSIGVIAAVHQNSAIDNASMIIAVLGVSVPPFYLGILLILLFSVILGWLPAAGVGGLVHLVLPSVTLAAATMAVIARMTRSSMLEILRQEFIVAARAKGLSETGVIIRHGLRNALVPIITVIGLQTGTLLGGAIFVEYVFSYPGIGWMMVEAISMRDYPIVQGGILLVATTFVFVNLLTDLLYGIADRRIRY